MHQITKAALICLLVAACGPAARQAVACRHEAGPEPGVWANMFGVVGALAAGQTQEHRDWTDRYLSCVRGTKSYAGKE